jgi:ABC-2 type transport system permease protein
VFLLTGALLAVGVFVSSLFSNQIAAFFGIMAAQLLFWVIDYPVQQETGPLAAVLKHIGFTNHFYNNFLTGVVDLTDIIYFVSVIVLFLFLAARIVESRRWR